MKELVDEKTKGENEAKRIDFPVNVQYFKLFEENENKLEEDLNEYHKAYSNAALFYVK